jgi:hypothetical protein
MGLLSENLTLSSERGRIAYTESDVKELYF